MYNAAFAYGPAAAELNSQYGPVGSTFYTSSALSGNVLKSGQTITFTFDDINASAPVTDGYNGYLYVAYTTTDSGSTCAGPIANLTQCSIFTIATINLK
jgi:hypothetical protein